MNTTFFFNNYPTPTSTVVFGVTLVWLALLSCNKQPDQVPAEEILHAHSDEPDLATDIFQITSKQYIAAGIELGHMKKSPLTSFIEATGTLDLPPQSFAEVSTSIGGIIKSIDVIEGDYVRKNQAIMTLSTSDLIKLQEDYLTSKSNLSFLEKDYARQKELNTANVNSGKTLQEAESKYEIEKAKLASLKRQLALLYISTDDLDKGVIVQTIPLRSPISGYIGHIHVGMGSYAEPNKTLFDVIDNSNLHVHLDIFEQDISKVKVGQKISVILPNQDDIKIEGKIVNIGKAMDPQTKSVSVHAEIINNTRNDLLPGTFVTANIHVENQLVDALPEEAIVRAGENEYLFIVVDSIQLKQDSLKNNKFTEPHFVVDAKGNRIPLTFQMIEVSTKSADNGYVEVNHLSRIAERNQVVIKGAYYLLSHLKSGETAGCCAPGAEESKK